MLIGRMSLGATLLTSLIALGIQLSRDSQEGPLPAPAAAAATGRMPVQVMLLGVFHFNNPGADQLNTEVPDYLQPERQDQIFELNDRLAGFDPQKIFIEQRPNEQGRLEKLYTRFRAGQLDLERMAGGVNEIYQIGFKLARELEHERLYCVDADGLWLGALVNKVARAQELSAYLDFEARAVAYMAAENKNLSERSVTASLIHFNT